MKKRRMLALALALALIMSLVPVSGLAAEPVGFMDPGAVMQEDTEESVNTEAVNGEEALSPDTVGDGEEGSWQDPAGSAEDNGADQALEEMPAAEDDGADQALEETPAAEDDGADQALEETTAVEDDGADQALEETPAVEDDGADQALEETPAVEDDGADQAMEETPAVEDDGADQDLEEEAAVEEENSEPLEEEDAEAVEESTPDQNEETADAQEAVSEDAQEAAAADTQEAGPVDETAVPAEDGSAAESAVDETMLPAEEESLADTSVNEVEDGYSYVLMNIPYAEFYAAELEAGSPAVDAVASATKNKPRTGTLAGGSYHVDPEGTDISGVIYPVKASNDDIAALIAYDENLMITDESIIAITVTNRGQETTTWYEGRDALFEAPDHSFYITDDDPAYYKEMTMEADGTMTFGPVQGDAVSVEGVTGAVTIGARHANIEIKLSGTDGVAQGDAVSGAVVTAVDDEGNATQYGLRHVVNIWRGTEIGWNYDELDIYGKTITNIRYYKQDAVIDYPVDIPVRAQYVLMNIPYADFYAAELKAGSAAVDAVASATKSKPLNARLAGGSYHVNADGSDISGVIYPVKVNSPEDLAKLEEKGAAVITDDSSVEVSVPGRNGADPTITVYNGKDALFQAPDYSYYDLGSGIQSFFKELTVAEDGSLSFGAVKGSTTRAEAEVSVTANASHTYYEMKVTSDYVQTGDTVSAVVMTAEDGTTYGLRHMANLWRGTEIGFEADETFSALIGKKITGLKFITQNGIYNFTVDALIPEKLPEYVLMNIPYADFYAAELAQGSPAVDAVASATKNKPRTGTLAGGSYHVDPEGTDISGVIYPVKVGKGFQPDPAKQITDESSVTITVTNRGQETTTEYTGRNALFEAPDYSWYALSAEEVPAFFKEVRSNHGNTSFGAAVGEILTAQATAEVKAKARHADYEIKLTPDEGVLDQAADVVNAVVLTDSEGNTYGLRHVVNIWRVLEVGFNRDEPAGALAGKKITNIRYFKQNGIVDLTVDIDVPVLSTAVTLDKTSVSLLAGKTAALTATVDPEQAAQAVTWTSSDENVVTVDENGVLTAVAAGTATVTAAAADNTGASAVCEVTVTKPVSSIKLDKTSASILRGKTVTLKATVSPDDAANKAVAWSSSDKKIATVDAKGVVTGVAKGTATITAKAKDGSGVKATCKITVKQPVTKITLSKTSASILRNKTITLKATAGLSSANDKSVAWTTSNKKVATVDSKGVVKGIAKGTATITAMARDGSKVKATCKITVKQPVTKITLSKTSASILRNKTITLKATAGPSSANDKSVAWTTSNKKVATVDSKGVVKGIAKGTATITATARDGSKVKATCKITVKQPVTKITLNKKSASILRNKTITLKAAAGPSSANDKTVTWTTSNKKVATVNSKGVVKGIAKGTATITATAKDGSKVKAVCKITVKQPVTKLTINKTKLTVKKGKTATLKVTVAPSSANDKSLKWTTSNKNIATVTQKGVVKGIKTGTVTITAAARDGSGKKVTCKITVQ